MNFQQEKNEQERYWLQQLKSGDEAGLQAIFYHFYQPMLQEAYRFTADRSAAKDLAQEVFVEIWKRREQLDIQISLKAYLLRAVRNRALNFIKVQKRYLFDEIMVQTNLPERIETTEKTDPELEKLNALHRAIALLPEKCRIVFTLSRFEELSHREIASRLDISVKTIENQITKALKTIREYMEKHPNLSAIVIFWVDWLRNRGFW